MQINVKYNQNVLDIWNPKIHENLQKIKIELEYNSDQNLF